MNINKDIENFCLVLYNEPAYRGNDITQGTYKASETILPINKPLIAHFNKPFNLIIEQLKKCCDQNKINKEGLKLFATRFKARDYYVEQSQAYYSTIKYNLEVILTYMQNPTTSHQKKIFILSNLNRNLTVCGPGAFTYIEQAKQILTTSNQIEYWLANALTLIVQELAERHIYKKKITDLNAIHVTNCFLFEACKQGWNVLGFESLSALNETFYSLAKITPQDLKQLTHDFFQEYDAHHIMFCLSEQLYSAILTQLKKHTGEKTRLKITSYDELKDILHSLPVVGEEEDWNNYLFDNNEVDNITASFVIELNIAGYIQYLTPKPPEMLRLSLTRYFNLYKDPFFTTIVKASVVLLVGLL